MNLINLTPHPLRFVAEGVDISVESVGTARCALKTENINKIQGIPVVRNNYGDVIMEHGTPFPEEEEGTIFIVSKIAADSLARAGRKNDIFFVANTVRDKDTGAILYATAIAQSEL